jgi:hypothetical protein
LGGLTPTSEAVWRRLLIHSCLASLGECPSYFLEAEQGQFNNPIDIIEWLLELPNKFDREHGFPYGVNFVSYSFNYDVTQILLGFLRPKVWEITTKRSWKTKAPSNYRVFASRPRPKELSGAKGKRSLVYRVRRTLESFGLFCESRDNNSARDI